MAHFAKLDENNIVLEVNVVANDALDSNDEEASGIAFLTEWSGGYTNWKQTSYNGNFRKQYAGIGYSYDSVADVFIGPQPYVSWSLDKNYDWQPPISMPQDNKIYAWNEETLSWDEVELPTE
jgi:hypothetical protein